MTKQDEKRGFISSFFYKRQHPLIMLSYLGGKLWLLAIPLAKYLIADQFNFKSWFRSHWLEISVVVIIFAYAVFRWISVYYETDEDSITTHSGFFGLNTTKVYYSQISVFSLNQGYFHRFFRICTIYVDTGAKSKRKSDISFDLTTKRAFELYHGITKITKNKPRFVYKSKKGQLAIFSFLFSSTFSGTLVAVGIVWQAYRIMGREAELRLLREVNSRVVRSSVLEIIPAYILAGVILISGMWLISFLSNLMRHWGFSCTKSEGIFIIRSGKGSRRRHVLRERRINYIDYRQSFLMKIFGVMTVSVGCTGYGKKKREISALVPITTSSSADTTMKALLPDFPPIRGTVATDKSSTPLFILLPGLSTLIPPIAAYIAFPYFPDWHRQIVALAVIAEIPLIWLTIVKAAASLCTFMGFKDGFCTMSFCSWYKFHKVAAPVKKIAKIVVTRHPFQHIGGGCNVYVYTNSDKATKHAVKGLNYKKVVELLTENGCEFEIVGDEQ